MTPSPFASWLSAEMTELGFRRQRAQHLYVRDEPGGNVGALRFRVRTLGVPGQVTAFVHLCVVSRRLAAVFGEPAHLDPEEGVQPWVRWSGHIHEPFDEEAVWHRLDANDATLLARAEADLRERIVPALIDHIADDGLRTCWRRYDDPLLPQVIQLTYLAILEQELAPPAELAETMARLEAVLGLLLAGDHQPGVEFAAPGLRHLGLMP